LNSSPHLGSECAIWINHKFHNGWTRESTNYKLLIYYT
jgi:hypothetical protein